MTKHDHHMSISCWQKPISIDTKLCFVMTRPWGLAEPASGGRPWRNCGKFGMRSSLSSDNSYIYIKNITYYIYNIIIIYIYTCMHIYIYTCMHLYIYIQLYASIYLYIFSPVCIYIYIYIYLFSVHICTYVCKWIYTY